MIKVVAIKAFPLTKTKNGNHLIIISDMLHNSSDYSHYQSAPDIKRLHFSVNKNILPAMKARAIVEESECYNNIIKLENQIVQQFNKYNHNCSNSSSSDDDGSSSSPPSPSHHLFSSFSSATFSAGQ